MSTKIYFNSSDNLKRIGTLLYTTLFRYLAPKKAISFARDTLLSPLQIQRKIPKEFKTKKLLINGNSIMHYEIGEGEEVLLVHGWSGGGFQFFNLMKKISSLGYKAISFDFLGHGYSDKSQTSLPHMINTLDAIQTQENYDPKLVICHSMGASIFVNSVYFQSFNKKLLLISPLLQTYKMLLKSSLNAGFNQYLFHSIVDETSQNEGLRVQDLNAEQYLKSYTSDTLTIVHDTNDPFAPILDSKLLAKKIQCNLIELSKVSHRRIISTPATFSEVEKLLDIV